MNRLSFLVIVPLLLGFNSFSQDSVATKQPVESIPFLSVDLGVDYIKLVSLALPDEDKYEGIAAINFGFGLSIDGEYGYTKKSPRNLYKNGDYTFEGTYYRIGLGYQIPILDNNIIGIGVRYATASFEDHTSFTIKSRYFGDEFQVRSQPRTIDAQWAEIVLKTEGPLKKIKNLKLGMFIRLKYLDPLRPEKIEEFEDFPVQGIPGYGIAKAKATAAVNFYIKYSIPFIK